MTIVVSVLVASEVPEAALPAIMAILATLE
jgi:hypothetical protein